VLTGTATVVPVVSAQVAVGLGQDITCSITNNDQPGTIIIRKLTNPLNSSQSFDFDAGGTPSTYNDFSLTGVSAGGANLNSQTLNAGSYTVQEINIPANWTLTGVGQPGSSTCELLSTTGAGTSTGSGDVPTATATITLAIGDTIRCTFENTREGVTRTQGFWATHPLLADAAWFGGDAGGHHFLGVAVALGDASLCGRPITTLAQLMSGFWSDIPRDCNGIRRSKLDQAKMRLLQQLLAAELNYAAFGTVPDGGVSMFTQWETAFCGSDLNAVQLAATQAAAYNEQYDSGVFTPGTSADPKAARAAASQAACFWSTLSSTRIESSTLDVALPQSQVKELPLP
jgi:hypothetical protein